MSVVPLGSLVLVTGANGFIAMWIIRTLLEKGYRVRGTVRSSEKIAHIKKTFEKYGDKIEVVVVEDLIKEGAFDEAVKGVSAIHHVASPMSAKGINGPEDFLNPAIKGTTGVFESVLKYGAEVKSIVITSSIAAIAHLEDKGVLNETQWNTKSMQKVENLPTDIPWYMHAADLYAAAKANAEKAAWDISKKEGVKWQLATICPSIVIGPVIQECPTTADLNSTVQSFYGVMFNDVPKEQTYWTDLNWVDVRDVALAHVLAMEKAEAAGQRFIVSNEWTTWDYWFDLKKGLTPEPSVPGPDVMVCDGSKVKETLGLKFRNASTTLKDMKEDFAARGWLA